MKKSKVYNQYDHELQVQVRSQLGYHCEVQLSGQLWNQLEQTNYNIRHLLRGLIINSLWLGRDYEKP